MSQLAPNHSRRGARVAVAACLGFALALSGCASRETSEPYQPAAGVQTNAAGVMVRNLMFVTNGSATGTLQGTLITAEDDTLTSISGKTLNADNSDKADLSLAIKNVAAKQGVPLNLADQKVQATGLMPGGMTRLTLNFSKAVPVTLMVPVTDAKSSQIDTQQ